MLHQSSFGGLYEGFPIAASISAIIQAIRTCSSLWRLSAACSKVYPKSPARAASPRSRRDRRPPARQAVADLALGPVLGDHAAEGFHVETGPHASFITPLMRPRSLQANGALFRFSSASSAPSISADTYRSARRRNHWASRGMVDSSVWRRKAARRIKIRRMLGLSGPTTTCSGCERRLTRTEKCCFPRHCAARSYADSIGISKVSDIDDPFWKGGR
jgi:hypothetical protein